MYLSIAGQSCPNRGTAMQYAIEQRVNIVNDVMTVDGRMSRRTHVKRSHLLAFDLKHANELCDNLQHTSEIHGHGPVRESFTYEVVAQVFTSKGGVWLSLADLQMIASEYRESE
jgi:hypothetical protein